MCVLARWCNIFGLKFVFSTYLMSCVVKIMASKVPYLKNYWFLRSPLSWRWSHDCLLLNHLSNFQIYLNWRWSHDCLFLNHWFFRSPLSWRWSHDCLLLDHLSNLQIYLIWGLSFWRWRTWLNTLLGFSCFNAMQKWIERNKMRGYILFIWCNMSLSLSLLTT